MKIETKEAIGTIKLSDLNFGDIFTDCVYKSARYIKLNSPVFKESGKIAACLLFDGVVHFYDVNMNVIRIDMVAKDL